MSTKTRMNTYTVILHLKWHIVDLIAAYTSHKINHVHNMVKLSYIFDNYKSCYRDLYHFKKNKVRPGTNV